VNIALTHKQEVILGVVYVPPTKTCYYAAKNHGAYKVVNGHAEKIQTRSLASSVKKGSTDLVGSRRHGSDALEALVIDLKKELCDTVDLISQGSSLKFCALAEGRADLYPRLALTCEWDTAAAQIVLEEAGGAVLNPDLTKMKYNTKAELLNPFFWAIADNCEQWQTILKGRIS